MKSWNNEIEISEFPTDQPEEFIEQVLQPFKYQMKEIRITKNIIKDVKL